MAEQGNDAEHEVGIFPDGASVALRRTAVRTVRIDVLNRRLVEKQAEDEEQNRKHHVGNNHSPYHPVECGLLRRSL